MFPQRSSAVAGIREGTSDFRWQIPLRRGSPESDRHARVRAGQNRIYLIQLKCRQPFQGFEAFRPAQRGDASPERSGTPSQSENTQPETLATLPLRRIRDRSRDFLARRKSAEVRYARDILGRAHFPVASSDTVADIKNTVADRTTRYRLSEFAPGGRRTTSAARHAQRPATLKAYIDMALFSWQSQGRKA